MRVLLHQYIDLAHHTSFFGSLTLFDLFKHLVEASTAGAFASFSTREFAVRLQQLFPCDLRADMDTPMGRALVCPHRKVDLLLDLLTILIKLWRFSGQIVQEMWFCVSFGRRVVLGHIFG